MKKRSKPLLVGRMVQRLAPRIGAKVVIEPTWKVAGQIRFKNGRRRYFHASSIDLNTLGASRIAKDKDYANFFMQKMGYRTIRGRTFFSDDLCREIGSANNIHAGYTYARRIGFPVIVKPNSSSQGFGVCKAYTKEEFYNALGFIFTRDRIALVQKPMKGKDYRIVVLDHKVISAYQRIPLHVVGNGTLTVHQLLKQKQAAFIRGNRDTVINQKDFRIARKLQRQGFSFSSVIKKGETVFLLDNANLSSGGDAIDVTDVIHGDFKKLAIDITHDMGLRFCGVDILVEGDIAQKMKSYSVLEINSAPGLDHYVLSGKRQEKIVEDMYFKMLKAMERAALP